MNAGLPAMRTVRAARRLPFERGAARLSHRLPARRTSLCSAGSRGTRDAETIQYLNRPSDALFVWSRWESHTWVKYRDFVGTNRAASGQREK